MIHAQHEALHVVRPYSSPHSSGPPAPPRLRPPPRTELRDHEHGENNPPPRIELGDHEHGDNNPPPRIELLGGRETISTLKSRLTKTRAIVIFVFALTIVAFWLLSPSEARDGTMAAQAP